MPNESQGGVYASELSDRDIVLTTSADPERPALDSRGAVLLLHGLTGTPEELSDLARFLHDRRFDCFVPCLSGHGTSINDLKCVHTDEWIRDVEQAFSDISIKAYDRIVVVGMSFGALLAMHLAYMFRPQIHGLVLISVPMRFRRTFREWALRALSYVPESLLDGLGVVDKTARSSQAFVRPRPAYAQHSVGAGARLLKVRRRVLMDCNSIQCPTLVLHDDGDHHLSPEVPSLVQSLLSGTEVKTKGFPGGQHEMVMGHSYREVQSTIADFIESLCR